MKKDLKSQPDALKITPKSMKRVVQIFLHYLHMYWIMVRTPLTEEEDHDRQTLGF